MTLPIEIIRIDRQGEEILGITIALKPLLDRIRELEQERDMWRSYAQNAPGPDVDNVNNGE